MWDTQLFPDETEYQGDREAECNGSEKEEFHDRNADDSHHDKADREYDSGKLRGCIGYTERPGMRLGGAHLHDFIVPLKGSLAKLPPTAHPTFSRQADVAPLASMSLSLTAYCLLLSAPLSYSFMISQAMCTCCCACASAPACG